MSPLQLSTMGVIEAGLNPTVFRLFSKPDFKNYGLGGNPLEPSAVSTLYQSCPRIKSIVMDFSYTQCTWRDCHEYMCLDTGTKKLSKVHAVYAVCLKS